MPTMFLPKSTPRTIGFIGLGSMGSRMAAQLASSLPRETTLLVLDAAEKTLDTFITEHATGTNNVRHAESASDVAAAAQIVFTALPGPAESRVVYDEMSRAIRAGDPGKIFLECGTVRSLVWCGFIAVCFANIAVSPTGGPRVREVLFRVHHGSRRNLHRLSYVWR